MKHTLSSVVKRLVNGLSDGSIALKNNKPDLSNDDLKRAINTLPTSDPKNPDPNPFIVGRGSGKSICPDCHHSLENNSHGFDQNDAVMDGDKLVHSGHCTYCRKCNPGIFEASAPE